jgi:hypothetical protein
MRTCALLNELGRRLLLIVRGRSRARATITGLFRMMFPTRDAAFEAFKHALLGDECLSRRLNSFGSHAPPKKTIKSSKQADPEL